MNYSNSSVQMQMNGKKQLFFLRGDYTHESTTDLAGHVIPYLLPTSEVIVFDCQNIEKANNFFPATLLCIMREVRKELNERYTFEIKNMPPRVASLLEIFACGSEIWRKIGVSQMTALSEKIQAAA